MAFGDNALKEVFIGRIGDLGPVITVDEESGMHAGSVEFIQDSAFIKVKTVIECDGNGAGDLESIRRHCLWNDIHVMQELTVQSPINLPVTAPCP